MFFFRKKVGLLSWESKGHTLPNATFPQGIRPTAIFLVSMIGTIS